MYLIFSAEYLAKKAQGLAHKKKLLKKKKTLAQMNFYILGGFLRVEFPPLIVDSAHL